MTTKQRRPLLLAPKHAGIQQPTAVRVQPWETGKYKEVNIDLDRYNPCLWCHRRMYQSPRDGAEREGYLQLGKDRIGDYKIHAGGFQRENPETWEHRAVRRTDTDYHRESNTDYRQRGRTLYKSVSDLVLYATAQRACSTSDLFMALSPWTSRWTVNGATLWTGHTSRSLEIHTGIIGHRKRKIYHKPHQTGKFIDGAGRFTQMRGDRIIDCKREGGNNATLDGDSMHHR